MSGCFTASRRQNGGSSSLTTLLERKRVLRRVCGTMEQVVSVEDIQLNCIVRNVLTRHWLDVTKMNFFVGRGNVHMSGEVSVIGPRRTPEDTAIALRAFESDVRRLRDVKSMSFEFTNWTRDDSGAWHELEREEVSPHLPQSADGP